MPHGTVLEALPFSMKTLFILAVLLGLAYFFLYDNGYDQLRSLMVTPRPTRSADAPATPGGNPPTGGASFDGVTALLRQDMDAIPVALDGPGRPPVNAQAVKRKLVTSLNLHPEYQTLTQACDLIIDADAQRTPFQASSRAEQDRISFGGTLDNTGSMDHAVPASGHALALQKQAQDAKVKMDQQAIHQRVESSWSSYRTRTAGQVQQLLASLAGKHI